MTAPELYKVIERDPYGNARELHNMSADPWTCTFTLEQAQAAVEWREKNISRKYWYEIVPAVPS